MKLKNLLFTTLLAAAGLSLVNKASAAATDVYISGATTYRACVTSAILDQGTNGILVSGSTTCAYVGSSVYKANEAIFHGYLKGSGEGNVEVYIHTYWTGSAAGVYDVAAQNPVAGYIEDPASITGTIPGSSSSGTMGPVAGTNPAAVTNGVLTTYTGTSHAPDAVMSDSLNTSVANVLNTAPPAGSFGVTVTGAGLLSCGNSTRNTSSTASTAGTVGVAPMLWVVGNSAIKPNFSDMSQQAARSVIGGPTSAELFSGLHADKTNWVILVGRNEDSGTRIGAFAEAQFGLISTGLKQYLPTFGGTVVPQTASPGFPASGNPAIPEGGPSATVTGFGEWPTDWTLNTEANIDWTHAGHSGFTGGGDVANCLAASNPVTGLNFTASGTEGDYLAGSPDTDPNVAGGPSGYSNSESVWMVGYLGVADAIGGGAFLTSGTTPAGWTVYPGQTLNGSASVPYGTVLSYNGVQYTGSPSIEQGSYTYWVLEHMYYNPSNTDTNSSTNPQKECVDDIADFLFTYYAASNSSGITDTTGTTLNNAGILYSNMDFTRSAEGVVPTTK